MKQVSSKNRNAKFCGGRVRFRYFFLPIYRPGNSLTLSPKVTNQIGFAARISIESDFDKIPAVVVLVLLGRECRCAKRRVDRAL